MIIQMSSSVEEPACLSGKVLNLFSTSLMDQEEVISNQVFSFTYQLILVLILAQSAGSCTL